MRPVIQYQASDGSIHATDTDAVNREILLDECREVEAILGGPRPSMKHGAFVKHPQSTYLAFHRGCVAIARHHLPHEDFWAKWDAEGVRPEDIHPGSYLGRVINESGRLAPLDRLWHRLYCFDREGNEWEQPYFANISRERGKAAALAEVWP